MGDQSVRQLGTPRLPWRREKEQMDCYYRLGVCNFICWVGCCPPWPATIIGRLFVAPQVSSYKLVKDNTCVNDADFRMRIDPDYAAVDADIDMAVVNQLRCRYVTTTRGNRIAMARLPFPGSRRTVLLSHPNGMDMGMMTPWLKATRTLTQCEVVTYDYSGYGASSDIPTEANMKADIEAVVDHLNLFNTGHQLILWGGSLGSFPTLWLAAKIPVRGVIVEGAFSHACGFLESDSTWCCIDQFKSVDSAPHIRSPVLVIHGRDDNVVGMSHAERLVKLLPNAVAPYYVDGGEHGRYPDQQAYLARIRHFLQNEMLGQGQAIVQQPR